MKQTIKRRLWCRYPEEFTTNLGIKFWGYILQSVRYLEDNEQLESLDKEEECDRIFAHDEKSIDLKNHILLCTDENFNHIPIHSVEEGLNWNLNDLVLYEGNDNGLPFSEI